MQFVSCPKILKYVSDITIATFLALKGTIMQI